MQSSNLSMATPNILPSDRAIWSIWMSQYSQKILSVLLEENIFEILFNSPKTIEELVNESKLHKNPLLECLHNLLQVELLNYSPDTFKFSLSIVGEKFLIKRSPFYWGYMMKDEFGLSKESLQNLLRTGEPQWPILKQWENGVVPNDRKEQIMRGMNSHSAPAAKVFAHSVFPSFILPLLPSDEKIRWVDVAGGSGIFTSEIYATNKEINCSILELPDNVSLTKQFVDQFNSNNQIEVKGGNMFSSDWPISSFIFQSEIWHDWNDDQCLQLAISAKKAGKVYILNEVVKEEDEASKANDIATLFSLHMMFCTRGKQRTFREFEDILKRAGFTTVTIIPNYYSVWSSIVAY